MTSGRRREFVEKQTTLSPGTASALVSARATPWSRASWPLSQYAINGSTSMMTVCADSCCTRASASSSPASRSYPDLMEALAG